jgi:YidC/Oxa1 family membrane protein insertase
MRGFDKNQLIGILLIGAILVGYAIYTKPSEDDLKKFKQKQDSIELTQSNKQAIDSVKSKAVAQTSTPIAEKIAENTLDSASQASVFTDKFGAFASSALGKDTNFLIENENLKIELSAKGGSFHSVKVKGFKTYKGAELELIKPGLNNFGLSFFAANRVIQTSELYFTPVENTPNKIVLRLNTSNPNAYIDYVYQLKPNKYDLDFDIVSVGMDNVVAGNVNKYELSWSNHLIGLEKELNAESLVSTVYFQFSDKEVDYLSESEDDKEALKTKVKWVSFKQQFFTSILTSRKFFESGDVETQIAKEGDTNLLKMAKANLVLPFDHQAKEVQNLNFYFGPNKYKELVEYDLNYEKQIPLGWGFLGWINKGIVIQVFHFLGKFGLNYGIIILILTLIIKFALSPLTYRSYLSQAKMKLLKPEIDEIDAKHNGDAIKSQQEKMTLFKKAGVSPLGGCLPMLLQMPILIALFRFFPASFELRQQPFLWADDLSTYDDIIHFDTNIWLLGNHLSIFNILLLISTILYTRMNSNQFAGSGPQAKQMQIMGYIMPFIFFFSLNNSSA